MAASSSHPTHRDWGHCLGLEGGLPSDSAVPPGRAASQKRIDKRMRTLIFILPSFWGGKQQTEKKKKKAPAGKHIWMAW